MFNCVLWSWIFNLTVVNILQILLLKNYSLLYSKQYAFAAAQGFFNYYYHRWRASWHKSVWLGCSNRRWVFLVHIMFNTALSLQYCLDGGIPILRPVFHTFLVFFSCLAISQHTLKNHWLRQWICCWSLSQ